MNCAFNNQLLVSVFPSGLLCYGQCCVLWREVTYTEQLDDFLNCGDVKEHLNKIMRINPPNHNFHPKSNDCWNTETCDFSNCNIETLCVTHRACNLDCITCNPLDRVHTKEEIDKSIEFYFKMLNKCRGVGLKTLQLSSNGEPFVRPKPMIDFIKSLKKEDVQRVVFVTNATTISESDIQEMFDATSTNGVKMAGTVSIDGITSETYMSVRKVNSFEKVVKNALKMKSLGCLDFINYVITPTNVHELKEVPEFWLSKGITPRIIFPICKPEWEQPLKEHENVKWLQENHPELLRMVD